MLDRLTIERMTAEAGDGPILVALSGGGDSTALLHLLAKHFGPTRVCAAVVDHALRDGSAADAERALGFARDAGVAGEVLTLAWPNGRRRAQQAAREARYAALCGHARAIGARMIAVAHNADDQAETMLMRAANGSTWRGLASIAPFAPAPIWPEGRGVWIARPLLGARREALRAYLRDCGASWIEDPANADPSFERVRVRAQLAAMEAEGFDPMRLVELAQNLRSHADTLDDDAAVLIAAATEFEGSEITLFLTRWKAPLEVRLRALSALIAAAAGAAREPAHDAVKRIEARMAEDDFVASTLGGAALMRWGDWVQIERDRGAVTGRAGVPAMAPLALVAGVETVWDGRLAITVTEPWSIVIEDKTPVLANADRRRTLAETGARWVLAERMAHALGVSLATREVDDAE